MEVVAMSERKKDPSTIGLSSPQVEGQGTTNVEFDGKSKDSARRKTKKRDV
jgi:hypothetical protein